jgi:LysR family transcriptional regulator, glycine cleavage system transcriptional activator
MARRLPPLNALRAFEAAARHNGFTGAAAELRVSHAAISRHVRALEARLGVTLFRKAKRGVELTAGGQRYLQAVSAAFDSIAAATDTVATAAQAQIRASVHPAFAGRWLIHHLSRFRQAYPDYDVVLDATPRAVDLEHDEADLAIRIGAGEWPGVGAELLAPSRLYPVGAPALLSRRGSAFTPPELTQFVLLHDEDDGGAWRHWFAAAGIADVDVSRGPRILESGLAIDAAIAGQGIALADDFLVADDLAHGRLVTLCDFALADCGYYLLTPGGTRPRRPLAAFRQWLLAETESLRSAA